MMSK